MPQELASEQLTPSKKSCPKCGLELGPSAVNCPRDGTNLIIPLGEDPTFAGKYEILGLVGSGGMGVIYKARQIMVDKLVAIKMVHPHISSKEAMLRFRTEGKAIALLEHPYIIGILDLSVSASGQLYMVMDYVNGKTLAEVLKQEKTLSQSRFVKIFTQVCDALAHAHCRGVLHRDIKPSNIMLVRNDQGQEDVRIMDFGIAKLLTDTESINQNLTKTGEAVGSPYYMSPEQAAGEKVDARSDLYSLGCVMYECLTGLPPFVGKTAFETINNHLNQKPLSLKEATLGQEQNPMIERMISRLLEKSPAARYQSMDSVVAQLKTLDRRSNVGIPEEPVRATTRSAPITRYVIAAATVGVLAVGGLCLYQNQNHNDENRKAGTLPQPGGAITSQAENKDPARTSLENEGVAGTFKLADKVFGENPNTAPAMVHNDSAPPLETKTSGALETMFKYAATVTKKDAIRDLVVDSVSRNSEDVVLDKLIATGISSGIGVEITKDDLSPLNSKGAITFTKNLSLHKLRVSDQALESISNLHLTNLELMRARASDLHAIKKMGTLKVLQLRESKVGPKGIAVIGGLKNLEWLDLGQTETTNSDLKQLYKLKKLKYLCLFHCPRVTSVAISELKQKLPQCHVSTE